MNERYFVIQTALVIIPLIGSILTFSLGLKKKFLAGLVATGAITLSFLASLFLFFQANSKCAGGAHCTPQIFEAELFRWISLGNLSVPFKLHYDALSLLMCLVITGIGSLIHLYSIEYMRHDQSVHRYFAYLNLFVFAMLLLVTGANLPMVFIGWEGVGICSFLLIGFWYKHVDYTNAARKAFVMNRIGDVGFLLGMFLLFQQFETLDFAQLKTAVTSSAFRLDSDASLVIFITLLCFFFAAAGKSAQLPLFTWLPDAMAGPTPVSALIHAATMVTAGVYLFCRFHFFMDLPHMNRFPVSISEIILIVALITSLITALIASAQNDIKKVLAYSTVSQLGLMFVAIAARSYWIAMFHLTTHAFFKALLFLTAGSVIHGCHGEQDIRKMGGLRKYMPITFVTFTLGTLAIAGIFPFAGYYSKHAILGSIEGGFLKIPYLAACANIAASAVSLLTAFYMTRLCVLTFCGNFRGLEHPVAANQREDDALHNKPHEAPPLMYIPLIVLAMFSVISGYILEHFLPGYLGSSIKVVEVTKHGEKVSTLLEPILGSMLGITGVTLGMLVFLKKQNADIPKMILGRAYTFLQRKFYIDEFYNLFIVKPVFCVAELLKKIIERFIIDGALKFCTNAVQVSASMVSALQSGLIRDYAFLMFLSSILLIACIVYL
jgi:NADH-quinone oxidoreductase subunit L